MEVASSPPDAEVMFYFKGIKWSHIVTLGCDLGQPLCLQPRNKKQIFFLRPRDGNLLLPPEGLRNVTEKPSALKADKLQAKLPDFLGLL